MSDNGNQVTQQDWRAGLDQVLAKIEAQEQAAAEAARQAKISDRDHFIDRVIDLGRRLGLEGEIREFPRTPDNPDWRYIPLIVCGGYAFEFTKVSFKTLNPRSTSNSTEKETTAVFSLDVKLRVIQEEDCPLQFGSRASCNHILRTYNISNQKINLTTGSGVDEAKAVIAKALRGLDEEVPYAIEQHQKYVQNRFDADETNAYFEKTRREIQDPEPEPEPDFEPEMAEEFEEPVIPTPPQPRQRIVYENTFEWRLLQLFDELRGIYE